MKSGHSDEILWPHDFRYGCITLLVPVLGSSTIVALGIQNGRELSNMKMDSRLLSFFLNKITESCHSST